MPAPKRTDVADFYRRLPDVAVPHLTMLRERCRVGLPDADEVLKWNTPAFVMNGTRLLVLQAFTGHASLRFPTRFFASQRADVEAAGYEAGAGFLKLPFDREVPVELVDELIARRLAEFEATGAGW